MNVCLDVEVMRIRGKKGEKISAQVGPSHNQNISYAGVERDNSSHPYLTHIVL